MKTRLKREALVLSDYDENLNAYFLELFSKKINSQIEYDFEFFEFAFNLEDISIKIIEFMSSIDLTGLDRKIFIFSKKVFNEEELKNIIRFRLDLIGFEANFMNGELIEDTYRVKKLEEIESIVEKPYERIDFKTYFDSDLILNEVFKQDRIYNNFVDELEFD
jgi:hypothetical protein